MFYEECQSSYFRRLFPVLLIGLCVMIAGCGRSTEAFLAKGEEYLQKRKFHDAMMQFRSAAESDSASAGAHWGLARSYENLGRFNEVLDELRKTIELDGTNLEAKTKLANYYLLVQPPMVAEAEKLRDEVLSADENFIEAHVLTAAIMAARGRPDAEVLFFVDKAIAMNPKRIQSYVSLERFHTTRERPAEAEQAIKRGIDANPENPVGYTEYGRFLMYAKRDAEAEAQLQKAVAIDTNSIESREMLAEFYVTSGHLDKAESVFQQLVEMQENSPESRLVLAKFYDDANREEESINVLEQILYEVPEYVLARYRLSEVYLERRELAKVYEQLDQLFKINDEDVEALTLHARAKLQENEPASAVKDLTEVLKKTPSGRDALYLMSQARLSLGELDQANAFIQDLERYHPTYLKTPLLRIQAAFTVNDAPAAAKLANELLAKAAAAVPTADSDPATIHEVRIRALTSRGLANLEMGELAAARGDLTTVLEMTPRSAPALVNVAKVFAAERNLNAARENYDKALTIDATSFDAMSGMVAALVGLGQHDAAHARIAELLNANLGRGEIQAALHYLNSTVFAAQNNAAEAERELTASIAIDKEYLPAYSAYAQLLVDQKRFDDAAAQYNKIIELRPAAQVYTLLGMLEESRANSAEAEKHYRKALEMTPDTAIAANNLAWLLAGGESNLDEALRLANIAVAKSPATAGYYDTLGWVYLKKGLHSNAVEQFKKAVALDEQASRKNGLAVNPQYRERLGQALARGEKATVKREGTPARSAGATL